MTGSELAPVAFGLASAALWGAGDFCGGLAARRAHVYSVIISSQIVGVFLLSGLALAFGETMPSLDHMLVGGAAGLAGSLGLIALYRALAMGRMSVAAPISAVVGAAVPVAVGAVLEGLPGAGQLAGFGLAFVAVWLISRADGAAFRFSDVNLPVLAGLGFGVFFVLIERVSDAAVLWPLAAARVASISVLLGVAVFSGRPQLVQAPHAPLIMLIGMLEVGGNAFFALAGRAGRLDVAAVISSLYPASTVILAYIILKERVGRTQSVGILAALTAIVLIAV
jgi:drug/metabolite transporter (DMT)-like permease